MALTTTTHPTKPWTTHNTTVLRPDHYPTPSPSALLQRRIEHTLIRISSLPESSEKVIIDLGGADAGGGWFAIQCNQLALFMQLEELVEMLEPEAKGKLIGGLHPAMSVQERKALGLVLERGLRRNVVPRPLEVRKLGIGKGEGGGRGKLYTAPALLPVEELVAHDSTADVDGLVFPELTEQELLVRERELAAARREQQGDGDAIAFPQGLGVTSTSSESDRASDSRVRRQEIAKMLSLAAKKMQVREESDASSDLAGPVHSPGLREGLQLIKTATSALRAYTDVTPREVAVKASDDVVRPSRETEWPRGKELPRPSIKTAASALRAYADVTPREAAVRSADGAVRPSGETVRRSKALPPPPMAREHGDMRPSAEVRSSSTMRAKSAEQEEESIRPASAFEKSDQRATPSTSHVPPSEDLEEWTSAIKPTTQELVKADNEPLQGSNIRITPSRFRPPPPIPSTADLHRFRNNLFPLPLPLEEASPSPCNLNELPHPHQQLSFLRDDASAHRINPPKLHHPPPPIPQPSDELQRPHSDPTRGFCPWPESFFTSPRAAPEPPRSVSLPHPPLPPPLPPTKKPIPSESPQVSNAVPIAASQAPSYGRKGSIAAARAGIAERVRLQQQMGDAVSTRSSGVGRWSRGSGSGGQSSRTSGRTSGSVAEEVEGGEMGKEV